MIAEEPSSPYSLQVPRKTRAVVLLECARLEEYDGNLAKAQPSPTTQSHVALPVVVNYFAVCLSASSKPHSRQMDRCGRARPRTHIVHTPEYKLHTHTHTRFYLLSPSSLFLTRSQIHSIHSQTKADVPRGHSACVECSRCSLSVRGSLRALPKCPNAFPQPPPPMGAWRRAILQRAHKETKHEWKVFLESILLELRAGNVDGAIRESLAALEVPPPPPTPASS